MDDALSLARELNALLIQYVRVHDEIFSFSVRKLLPIPRIFKPIHYCTHKETLSEVGHGLTSVLNRVRPVVIVPHSSPAERTFLLALEDYAGALSVTVERLRTISVELCRKSEGEGDYVYSTYERDMAEYNQLVERYRVLGIRLNSQLALLRAPAV